MSIPSPVALKAMTKGVPIRSLSRGIAVLKAINHSGSLTMTEITRACGLPFPTVSRLLESLIFEGLIEREPIRRRYRPTALVQTLAHGYQGDSRLVKAARPHIVELTQSVSWPITLSTHVGHSMVIVDSTHALSALTFNEYFPGYASPLLECAAGLVYLAALNEGQRTDLLQSAKKIGNPDWDLALSRIDETSLMDDIRDQGYAARSYNRFTRNPGKTSSIAAPIFDAKGPLGAVSLAYFASALNADEAIEQFAPKIRDCAAVISKILSTDAQIYNEERLS